VQDVENAAWKIAFDRLGLAGPRLLDSYELERRAAAQENLRVTGETMRFLVPHTEAEWARRRDVLERAIHDESARRLVNSGKLAEPYWYVDSPLSTGSPPADFPPGAGVARPPVAGVLCPDVALHGGRLRGLFGDSFVVLTNGCDVLVDATVPVRTYALDAAADPADTAAALGARPGWCGVVRPDGHLAAVFHAPTAAEVAAAISRACGHAGHRSATDV
jgi:hypothetical protein